MLTIGVSLKLYLDIPSTLDWCERVLALLADRPWVAGRVRLWVAPSLPALPLVAERVRGSALAVGAQDLFWAERGPYTGAVSGADLAALGCRYAVVGHAERRRLFGEDDAVVARKTAAALRTGLTPVICVGEAHPGPAAAKECVRQLDAALGSTDPAPWSSRTSRCGRSARPSRPAWTTSRRCAMRCARASPTARSSTAAAPDRAC
ncbi:hypothetical protein Prum_077130 [Phytohabitans rumicis]|uniref:Triosephosphate isomerase n=1 Tax=Phytohabitans rumicis TaxID=1076125 RepID=A0A6V8LGS9_9ACTN|nr:triose-phosphate isomerase family protein [Phytohabitans rumicis]GFJ94071.1 hypothetical protein Prum_077130 [Phytohabitans rumicis]